MDDGDGAPVWWEGRFCGVVGKPARTEGKSLLMMI